MTTLPAAVPSADTAIVGGKVTTVSTASQLVSTMKGAKAGDTVLLAPGNFGDVTLSNLNPTGFVTIKSANPDNDAVLRSLKLTRVSNLIIQDIDISRPLAAGVSTNDGAVSVNGGTNIAFVGIDVRGSMNGSAHDDGHGIVISSGKGISILDSTFQQLRTTVIVRGEDFLFAGNTVTQVREGISISNLQRGVFERNYMADWQANYVAKEHPDMFQVHSGNTVVGSSDLIFRNNVMLPGDKPVGGFFISSQTAAQGHRHENILIENNYYEGAYRHAISVTNVDNAIVRGNTVVMGDNVGLVPAINLTDLRGGIIERNITPLMLESRDRPNTGLRFADNVDLWDSKTKKGALASEVFPQNNNEVDMDFSHFNVIENSVASRSNAGFAAVSQIGDLSGSAGQQLATWLPTFDQHFAAFG